MGAIGWVDGLQRSLARGDCSPGRVDAPPMACLRPSRAESTLDAAMKAGPPVTNSPWATGVRGGFGRNVKIVTWLILPVVICLSQRLSHACLSISNIYRETANGSLNQLSFI